MSSYMVPLSNVEVSRLFKSFISSEGGKDCLLFGDCSSGCFGAVPFGICVEPLITE